MAAGAAAASKVPVKPGDRSRTRVARTSVITSASFRLTGQGHVEPSNTLSGRIVLNLMIKAGFFDGVKKLHSPDLSRTIAPSTSFGESHEPACSSWLCVFSILVLSAVLFAQQPAPAPETPKDTITRIFTDEFSEPFSPPPRWFDGGQSYTTMEPTAGGHGRDLVRYDTAAGKNREVLITAAQLTPEGTKSRYRSRDLVGRRTTNAS